MRNFNPIHKRIEAFIGAWGVKTGEISTADELMFSASRLFEIENTGTENEMVDKIAALGKKTRKRLVLKNMDDVFGIVQNERHVAPTSSDAAESGLQRMMAAGESKLIDGASFNCTGELDIDPTKLLRKVVSAVVSSGNAEILWEFPDVLAFFGSKIPNREEVRNLTNVDERMFETADKWPNRKAD